MDWDSTPGPMESNERMRRVLAACQDASVPWPARLVAVALCQLEPDAPNREVCLSVSVIGIMIAMGQRSVVRGLVSLERAGIVSTRRRPGRESGYTLTVPGLALVRGGAA